MHFYDIVSLDPEKITLKKEHNQSVKSENLSQRSGYVPKKIVSDSNTEVNNSIDIDSAGNSLGEEQVKSIDNLEPTENENINYSVDTDAFFEAFEELDEKYSELENL